MVSAGVHQSKQTRRTLHFWVAYHLPCREPPSFFDRARVRHNAMFAMLVVLLSGGSYATPVPLPIAILVVELTRSFCFGVKPGRDEVVPEQATAGHSCCHGLFRHRYPPKSSIGHN